MSFELNAEQRALRNDVPVVEGIPDTWEILPKPVYRKPQYSQESLTETSAGWGFIEHPVTARLIEQIDQNSIAVRPADIGVMRPTRHEIHVYWATQSSSSAPFLMAPDGSLHPDIRIVRMDPGIDGVGFDRSNSKGTSALNCVSKQNRLQCDGMYPVHQIIGWPTRRQIGSATEMSQWARQLLDVATMKRFLEWYRFVYDRDGVTDRAHWINLDAWHEDRVLGKSLEKLASQERFAPNGTQTERDRNRYRRAVEDLKLWRATVEQAYALMDAEREGSNATDDSTESPVTPDPIASSAPSVPAATPAKPATKRVKKSA